MANNLAGQFDLAAAKEGQSLTSITTTNTIIANFSDGFTSDTAADFTAVINWGDGTTSLGTVVGSNGSFTVEADHVYADEGTPTGVITITRTTDGAQLVLQGNVTVDDTDTLNGHSAATIVANANQALNNVTVATFTDPTYPTNVPSDFTVNIDWGDGTTTAGTLSASGDGSFTVSGSHTYTTVGQFTITSFMVDDGPQENATGIATSTADIGFGGVVTPPQGVAEFIAITTGTQVATFADNAGDPATDYVATIDWGDGSGATAASVSGSGGSFTVTSSSPHTYADEGNFTEVVTITNTADSAGITISGTQTVAENDNLSAVGTTITGSPGASTGNVTVATFNDDEITPATNPPTKAPNVPSDFVATIHWGDGQTSTGTVSGSAGTFTVSGAHTYAQNGQDTITVDISDDAANGQNFANATAQSTALIGLAPVAGSTLGATEGTPTANGTQVATFSDSNLSDTPADFSASIAWGDGTTSTTVTISGGSGSFTVSGGPHTYADEGQDTVTTVLTRTSDSTSATATGQANIAEADSLSLTAVSFSGNAGQSLTNMPVAVFFDNYGGNVASDFVATIEWGDGSTSPGTVTGSGGSFTIDGSHTYTAGGNRTVTVGVADDSAGTAAASGTATASINFGGTMVLTSATEGGTLSNTTHVATFSDSNLSDTAADFTASINWGDNVTTPGSVVGSNGSFTIEGGHTYADEGNEAASVTFTQTVTQSTATISGNVAVAEADHFTGQGTTFSAAAQSNFSGPVATFTDNSYTGQVPSDLAATIDWGDGITTAGTITGSNGSYTISGAHSYESGGQYTVNVGAVDDSPGTASFSVSSTANVSYAGQVVLHSATEGTALAGTTPIATFSDFNGGDTAGQFTATIDWGDNVTTPGTVVGSPGTFTVEGGHTYADETVTSGDPVSVTVTHNPDQVQGTFGGSVVVADADAFTPQGTSFTVNAQQPFSGTVATFTDSYTGQVASDLPAVIDWGDGQFSIGTVSGGSGSFTVSGSHTYQAGPQKTVKVTLEDDGPGKALATATTTANIVGGAIPFDFNADSISDLVFQQEGFNAGANAGAPQIWLWNGVGVTSQVTFPAPGASWHIITSRDVNGDGKADLIWQNSDGTPGIWLMNGTTPIAEVGLPNPGPSWHLVASGDTNGDGKSDLIWQNTDGTLGVWLMNGTTPIAEAGLANPGPNWKVVGTADYNADGKDDILLQDTNTGNLMIDLMNGTSISSTKTITVGDPSWHAVSTGEFNGQAEIAWQNNDGTVGLWLMNGTTPTAEAGLGNPGAGWQLISIDHFTQVNGQAGLLFQNTSGAMMLWEMNGTSVATTLNLPNPGAGWQSENGHPITPTNIGTANTNAATALNASDPGTGGLHSSMPDTSLGGGSSSPSNLQHLTFAGG